MIFKKPTRTDRYASIALASAMLALILVGSGCGQQEFQVGVAASQQKGVGYFTQPAKVDILLAEDDTGSMNEALPQIAQQIPGFLDSLESRGWDYRFATTPLTTSRPLTQILASKYDGNWAMNGRTGWLPAFPGAQPTMPGLAVSAAWFREPGQYTHFIGLNDINTALGAHEPGLATIRTALTTHAPSAGFLRSDALLVILTLSNGEDTSGGVHCLRSDGFPMMCNVTALDQFRTDFQNLKADPSLVKMYAAVAYQQTPNCLGATSRIGSRYHQLAESLGGQSYNVCNTPISTLLDSMAQHLGETKVAFRTRYLVLNHEPDLDTLRVVRPDGSEVANAPDNGWTYEGLQTVHTVDYPVPMNEVTGYVIELHGSARLYGDDFVNVLFEPKK